MAEKKQSGPERSGRELVLTLVLLLLIPTFGGYYPGPLLAAGAVLALLLLVRVRQSWQLVLPTGPEALALGGLVLFSLMGVPFAVSPGMALTGALRPVVWGLFFLAVTDLTDRQRDRLLNAAAWEGVALTLVTGVAFTVDRLGQVEDLNGRLGGPFQYANSWSVYLLMCLILLIVREQHTRGQLAAAAALAWGIFLTGSRGTLVLLVLFCLGGGVWYLLRRRRPGPLLAALAGLTVLGVLTELLTGGLFLERLSALSLSSSSLNGRLLYWSDALGMLTDHPLGVGWGGYIYLQPLYQTGVYVVRAVHNSFLQLALDGGILAGLCGVALILLLLLRKGLPLGRRLAMLALALHAVTDFDFEFNALVLLLLLCGAGGRTKTVLLQKRAVFTTLYAGAAAVLLAASLPYGLTLMGQAEAAGTLYPADLSLAEARIQKAPSLAEAEALADRITEQTELSMVAWDCKFAACAARNDLPGMVRAKYHYLRLSPYEGRVYQDFAALLLRAAQKGTAEEYREYQALAQQTAARLEEVKTNTSPLAYRIAEQPDWSFSAGVLEELGRLLPEI